MPKSKYIKRSLSERAAYHTDKFMKTGSPYSEGYIVGAANQKAPILPTKTKKQRKLFLFGRENGRKALNKSFNGYKW